MTSKELIEHYADLKIEIGQLEHEIADLCGKGWRMETDAVVASPAHEPYQSRPIPISGFVQSPKTAKACKRLIQIYDEKLRNLYFWQNKAEEVFDRIPEGKARAILRYRYIDGLEWQAIADKLNDGSTEASVKMRAKRILEKI